MRTALETKQTNRARVRDLLCGSVPRTTEAIVAAQAIIDAYELTAIDPETFAPFAEGLNGNDVCAITAEDTELTSEDEPWTADDVGKLIHVAGAGTDGGTLETRIAAFNSAGSIELADAAVTTTAPDVDTPEGLAVWGYPQNEISESSVLPTGGDTYEKLKNLLGNSGVIAFTDATLITSAVHNRKIIDGNRATGQTITLHKTAPKGAVIFIGQEGDGQITVEAESGAEVKSYGDLYKTAGKYASVMAYVRLNADGNSAKWRLTGTTGS